MLVEVLRLLPDDLLTAMYSPEPLGVLRRLEADVPQRQDVDQRQREGGDSERRGGRSGT